MRLCLLQRTHPGWRAAFRSLGAVLRPENLSPSSGFARAVPVDWWMKTQESQTEAAH